MKNSIVIGLFILFVSFQTSEAQNVGDKAPDFTVDLLSGSKFKLSDHSGSVVMIFFFGNTCPYCRTSGPKVEEVYQTFKSSQEFVAVGLDTWDNSSSEQSVSGFKSLTGLTFPLAIKAGSVSSSYSITYDRLLVIDQNGIIQHKGTSTAYNDVSTVKMLIGDLLDVTIDPGDGGATFISDANITSDNEKVQVFPNPASDVLYFSLYTEKDPVIKLMVYDITGKMLETKAYDMGIGRKKLTVDIHHLDRGIYIYKIKIDREIKTGSIFIQ